MEHSSVTTWVGRLRAGDDAAAGVLWDRYFARMVTFAREKLRGTSRRSADEEDVALSAFHSLCRAADRFPRLNDRQDLWQVIVMLVARKAFQERRRQTAAKRGGTGPDGDRRCPTPTDAELEALVGTEPDPGLAAMIADEYDRLLAVLPDDDLRAVARRRLDGDTAAEIAARLGCSTRTVERKLSLVRSFWEESANGDGPPADPDRD